MEASNALTVPIYYCREGVKCLVNGQPTLDLCGDVLPNKPDKVNTSVRNLPVFAVTRTKKPGAAYAGGGGGSKRSSAQTCCMQIKEG